MAEPVLRPPFPSSSHIIPLDWRNRDHRDAAARLIAEVLPDSPAAILGHDYLVNFHLLHLIRDGLMHCDLYECAGRIVGFVLYTARPFTFIREGRRRHRLALAYRLGKSVLSKPTRLLSILNVVKQGEWRRGATLDPALGEMLSLGVHSAFRSSVDPDTGSRISYALAGHAVNQLRATGSRGVLIVVLKGNERALSVFYKMGAMRLDTPYCSEESALLTIPLP